MTLTSPGERYVGRPAEYTISVVNRSDTLARDAVLTNTVPPGTEFVSASQGGQFGSGVVTWRLGTIEPGGARKVTITSRVREAGTRKSVAQASAYFPEGEASCETIVKGIPAVLLEIVDDPDPVKVGSNVTYTIIITNQGSADGTNIKLVAEIQPQAEYVGATGATVGTVVGRTVSFAPVPVLAPRAQAQWRVTVKAISPGDTRFNVTMTTDQTAAGGKVEEFESTHFYL